MEGRLPTDWPPDPGPPPELTEAVTLAKAQRADAWTSREALRSEIRTQEQRREHKCTNVRQKALQVIAQHAADTGLAAEVEALQREAVDKGLRLAWLADGLQACPDFARVVVARTRGCGSARSCP